MRKKKEDWKKENENEISFGIISHIVSTNRPSVGLVYNIT